MVAPSERTWLIFYHHSMEGTALEIEERMGAAAHLSQLEWKHFNDGFPNLQVRKEDAHKIESFYGTCILLSLHSTEVIFEQLALLYALPKMRARNLRVILPWFSTGTMERVETMGQVATAKTLARLISATPMGPAGPATVIIYDIHALQEQFYFEDTVLVELKSAVPLLRQHLQAMLAENPNEDFAIAFPDDGAHKRFKAKFPEYPLIVCAKERDGDSRVVKVTEGNPDGKHVIIVDDLVQSGGTLLECAKPLRAQGAKKVSCFVTHGVFPNDSYSKFVDNDLIDKFWVTNTIPTTAAKLPGMGPFEVLSIAPLVADYLRGAAVFD